MNQLPEIFNIYKNKKVLVTGDTGFKGSWLCYWLKEIGAEVLGISIPEFENCENYKILKLPYSIHHIDCDIRDSKKILNIFNQYKPDFVFHLAAQSLVRKSYICPQETFETNISGSVNILEAIRLSNSVKSLIYVTSDKCYKNKEIKRGYTEDDELGGNDPYSASKAAAEIVFHSYHTSFFNKGIGISSVRAGNVIGGGDWSTDRIIPDCFKSLFQQKVINLRNPLSVRPWQYVLDPLQGYLILGAKQFLDSEKYSGVWNFGPHEQNTRTVEELVESIIKQWGDGRFEKVPYSSTAPKEAQLLYLNSKKAYEKLDWQPKWDFERVISETVKWYRSYHEGKDLQKVASQQINQIMNF